jgi:hypothetical protein
MDSKSKEIILRHLKGIVTELEKDLKRERQHERVDFYESQFDIKRVNSLFPFRGKGTLNCFSHRY